MTVYLDVAFALNSALNYLLLRAGGHLAGAPVHRGRLGLAAALGGVYAALVFLPGFGALASPWGKGGMLLIMALLAFGAHRRTARLTLLVAALGAVMAGAAVAMAQLLGLRLLLLPEGVFYPLQARALLLLGAGCCGLCQVVFSFTRIRGGQLVSLTLCLGARSTRVMALIDTGNTLKDPLTGDPVLVADGAVLFRLLPEAAFPAAALSDPAALLPTLAAAFPALHFRLLHYRAVGTAHGLLLALPCLVTRADRRAEARLVAFSPAPVSPAGDFEALTGGIL